MFAEDSWLWSENGNDMKWNPTSNLETEVAPSMIIHLVMFLKEELIAWRQAFYLCDEFDL